MTIYKAFDTNGQTVWIDFSHGRETFAVITRHRKRDTYGYIGGSIQGYHMLPHQWQTTMWRVVAEK